MIVFQSLPRKANQSRNNEVCVVAPLFLYFAVHSLRAKEIAVLRSLFPDYVISFDYAAIYKKGDKGNIENYRPISFLNLYYKIYTTTLKGYLGYKNVFAIK